MTGVDVHLRDLRYFVTVAEERSFTKAAIERLFISQPALSKQIRQLESRLRAELFARNSRSVTLTAAGEALLPRARQLLAEWEGVLGAVQQAAEVRTLTVGLHARVGPRLVPDVTHAIDAGLPGWRVEFRQAASDDPAIDLAAEQVDVVVAWLPIPDGNGLSARILATEQRWVALPAGHPLADRSEIHFADLVDEPFVALPATAGPMREFWLATDQRTTPPNIATVAHTAEETFEAVAAGVGVVLLSATNAAIYERPGVVCRPVPDLPPSELAVLWRSADRRAGVRAVVDACCRTGGR